MAFWHLKETQKELSLQFGKQRFLLREVFPLQDLVANFNSDNIES